MNLDIVRAWKDADYRANLSVESLAQLPENPAGLAEFDLTEDELQGIAGATSFLCATAVGTVVVPISVQWCNSWSSGGSCQQGTDGCC